MVSTHRDSLKLFEFYPPFTREEKLSVYTAVDQSIRPHEVLKRRYFESCYISLLRYALDDKNQTKNFSLSIGRFIPGFDPNSAGKEIWDEDNIWIKVRVLGGAGDAFRSRFMATHMGIAKIDWKRKTFRTVKEYGPAVTFGYLAKSIGASGIGNRIATSFMEYIEKGQRHRASDRMSYVEYTPKEIFLQVVTANLEELDEISQDGQLYQMAEMVFHELVGAYRSSITCGEVIEFGVGTECFDAATIGRIFEEIVERPEATVKQFAYVFRQLAHNEIEARKRRAIEQGYDGQ